MARSDQKVTAEFVAERAALGRVASEIAEEAGVARQLIYQIARRHEISLPSGFARNSSRQPGVPRVVTGGIPDGSRFAVGSASEMLAAADLLARGWHVYIPIRRDRGHDLVACKAGMVRTFEVKFGRRDAGGRLRYIKSLRNKSDHHAAVLLGEPVIYEPPLPC